MAFDYQKYNNEYKRNNYDEMRVLVPKGRSAELKAMAKKEKVSLSHFVVTAIERYYNVDLSRRDTEDTDNEDNENI